MLDFIHGFIKGNGYSPTLREIMRALGYKSVSTVAKHVDNLVAAGFLEKQDGEVRSLTLSSEKKEVWWQNLAKEIKKREAEDDEKSRSHWKLSVSNFTTIQKLAIIQDIFRHSSVVERLAVNQ